MLETHVRSSSLATNSPYYHTTISSPGPNKARRPSLSNAMSWLTHTKGSASTSSLASPISSKHQQLPQISEPKLTHLDASVPSPRLGALGSGATVVRTPAEALSLAAQRQKQFENIRRPIGALQVNVANGFPGTLREDEEDMSPRSPASAPSLLNPSTASMMAIDDMGPTPRNSSLGSNHGSATGSGSSSRERVHVLQSSAPASPRSSPLSSSLKMRNSGSNYHAPYTHHPHPSLVSALPAAPDQPQFSALLLSHLPQNMQKLDPSQILVMLETSQGAQKSEKTTLATVLGRGQGSHLAEYLKNVVSDTTVEQVDSKQTVPGTPSTDDEASADGDSLYSQRSEFHDSDVDEEEVSAFDAIFQNQLGLAPSTGLAPSLNTSSKPKKRADPTQVVHIFLDRPSAPYALILSYLRTGMLPYAVRLPHSSSPLFCARLETLLELRDEAAYLGLDELQKLSSNELAGVESGSGTGERMSVHTLCDSTEADKSSSVNVHTHGHTHTQSTSNLHPHSHTHMRTQSIAKPQPSGPLPPPPAAMEPLLSPGLVGFQFPQRDQTDAQVQTQMYAQPPVQGRERQGSDGSLPAPVRNALHMRSKSRDPYGAPRTHVGTPVKASENYF